MDLNKLSLSEMMEKEDEILCDISLYERQILDMQLRFQKKKIDLDEYNENVGIINIKITALKEELMAVSSMINNRIKSNDLDYDTEEDCDVYGVPYEEDRYLEG